MTSVLFALIKMKTSVTVGRSKNMCYRCKTGLNCFAWKAYSKSIYLFSLESLWECTLIFVLKGSKRLILSCRLFSHLRTVTMREPSVVTFFKNVDYPRNNEIVLTLTCTLCLFYVCNNTMLSICNFVWVV